MIDDKKQQQMCQRLEKMRERALEFAQPRTSFQIEKFIGCDEHSLVTRYRHLAHNSFVTLKAVKDAVIEQEKTKRALARLAVREKSLRRKLSVKLFGPDDLDLERARLEERLEDLEITVAGGLREVDVFEQLCDELEKQNGGPFTYAQLEAEEPQYWKKRLSKQAFSTFVGRQSGVGEGNFAAMLQASELPILPGGKNVTEPFPLNANTLEADAQAPVNKYSKLTTSPGEDDSVESEKALG